MDRKLEIPCSTPEVFTLLQNIYRKRDVFPFTARYFVLGARHFYFVDLFLRYSGTKSLTALSMYLPYCCHGNK